jgi:type IV secretory pathway TrbF-like protein
LELAVNQYTNYRSGNLMKELRLIMRSGDGFTEVQLQEVTGRGHSSVRAALKAMPDTYIDRWTPGVKKEGKTGPTPKWVAVWDIVTPPEDAPRPA